MECETILTVDSLSCTSLTSMGAFFAIIIPFTFGLRTFEEPLSHEITAGRDTSMTAFPPSAGLLTVMVSPNFMSVTFETEHHPSLSATPGPVDPAPVSAADFPQ